MDSGILQYVQLEVHLTILSFYQVIQTYQNTLSLSDSSKEFLMWSHQHQVAHSPGILSMKLLSEKIVMLLLLLGGEMINSLTTFSVESVQLITTECTFIPCKLLKHSRPEYVHRPITYKKYSQNIKLRPVRLITEYIKRWNNLRQGDTSINNLFITYEKTIRAAHRDTMALWTKIMMNELGVDTKIFKPHSCRSASTPTATNAGVTIDNVLKQGNWTNPNTFYKYYFKEIENSKTFSEGLLLK